MSIHGVYTVHRPVVNEYLVRDRDRRRTRELLRLVAVVLPVALAMGLLIWIQGEVLAAGYRIHSLERELSDLGQQERRLELETASLVSPARVEAQAGERLDLRTPTADQIVFLEELE